MKKIKRTALLFSVMLLTVMCFAFSASAEDLVFGDYTYTVLEDGTVKITDYTGTEVDVVIPDEIDGKPVTALGSVIFDDNENMESITLPDSLVDIGSSNFLGTPNLKRVYAKDAETWLGYEFSIQPSCPMYHGADLYFGGEKVTELVIPESVTVIGERAFIGCGSIEKVVLHDGVTKISYAAFEFCENLEEIEFGNGLKVCEMAFAGCPNIKKVYIDSINSWLQIDFSGLMSSNPLNVGADLYVGGQLVKNLEIPDGVKTIKRMAFAGYNIKNVILPVSLTTIETGAFHKCKALTDVYYKGTEAQWKKVNVVQEKNEMDASIRNNDAIIDATKHFNYLGRPEKVVSMQNTSAIKLSWTAVSGAAGYKVYYKTANGWKALGNVMATTVTYSNIKPGSKYTFAVRAGKLVNGKAVWADSYTTHETATKAVAPTKIAAAQNTSAIKLSWTACAGATGYRIYFKSGNEWKVAVSTTDKTTHTFSNLKPGARFTFAVRPYIKTNDTFIWCDYTTCVAATVPEAPAVTVTAPNAGQINLTWNAVRGAESYNVYYKINNGAYKFYKTYKNAGTYTFNNLQGGNTFTFVVRAGIKTTSGNIWSSYTENPITLAYRIDRYNNTVAKGNFYMEVYDEYGIYNGMAMKNGSFCYDMKVDGERERVVYRSDTNMCYVISDTYKEYYAAPDDGSTKELVESMISLNSSATKYKTSNEKIGGKSYFVESYTDEDGATVKYYFDGINLSKESLVYGGEEVYMITYSKFTNKVPDSLFEIPSDYKKLELEE